MADTIIGYIKKYGDITFEEMPINDVDSLILCQLSYLKFDGMVPDVWTNERSVSMEDIALHENYEQLYADERYEKDNRGLFEAMLGSRRFRNLRLNCYINIIEKEWETQFSAITYLLDDGTLYIAFRGTDETIVGWKEDFNMAYLSPVPGQAYSAKYLNMVTGKLHKPFYVGGHSKGGNLAIYSAMKCIPSVQKRIIKIYNMDGPGFRPEVLEELRYEDIADRVVKILPQSSLVGMIFEKDIHYKVVDSKSFGLLQHNPYKWIVKDGDFVEVNGIYEGRQRVNSALNEWILSLEEQQLRTFVDTLYQVISASQAENLIEFTADWKKSMNAVMAALKEVDEETTDILREIGVALFDIMKLRMKRSVLIKRKAKEEKEKEARPPKE